MQPVFLDDVSFWDVVWWMIMVFFFMMFLWMFIAIFADMIMRRDLNGWAKAGWALFMFILPLLGILFYMITRPKPTEEEIAGILSSRGYGGGAPASAAPRSSADEIGKAHELLQAGALTQQEFDAIKAKAIS
jgi:hypothetical protein